MNTNIFSNEEIFRMMHEYISSNILSDNIPIKNEDNIYCEIQGKRYVIIAPVNIKQTPSLERLIKGNTDKGISTTIILPKSSNMYYGHYLKHGESYKFKDAIGERYHATAKLSKIEEYLLDNYNSKIPYFNPKTKAIENISFKRLPKEVFANSLGIPLLGTFENDEEIWARGRDLKKANCEGHSFMIKNQRDKSRYVNLAILDEVYNTIREKFVNERIKGGFVLTPVMHKGLLMGEVAQYAEIEKITQLSLF